MNPNDAFAALRPGFASSGALSAVYTVNVIIAAPGGPLMDEDVKFDLRPGSGRGGLSIIPA
jgi:hypothetical protein